VRKHFFLERKKQRTFDLIGVGAAVIGASPHLGRSDENKFLASFFKKEALP
jgi:hypothetical protein